MSQLRQQLQQLGPQAADLQVVFVTVDLDDIVLTPAQGTPRRWEF